MRQLAPAGRPVALRLAFGLLVVGLLVSDEHRILVRAAVFLVAGVFGSLHVRAAARDGGARVPEFTVVVACCVGFGLSNLWRAAAPDNGVGELLNGAASVLLLIAAVVFVRKVRSGHGWRIFLDGTIVGLLAAIVLRGATLIIGSGATMSSVGSVSLLLGLVGLSIWVRAIASQPSPPVVLFAAAAVTAVPGSVLTVVLGLGAARPLYVDMFTLVCAALLVVALTHPAIADPSAEAAPRYRPVSFASVTLILFAAVGGPVVIWIGAWTGQEPDAPLAIAVTALTAACIGRFALMLSERDAQHRMMTMQLQRDPLTGVASRRRLMEELNERLASLTPDAPATWSLLLLDLDDFKAVNDRFGHNTGDELLQAVADVLLGTVGESGVVARLAGDEFAVILDDEPENISADISAILSRRVKLPGRAGAGVRASVGRAITPTYGTSPARLIDQADQAMYAIKRRRSVGRRRHDHAPCADVRSEPQAHVGGEETVS